MVGDHTGILGAVSFAFCVFGMDDFFHRNYSKCLSFPLNSKKVEGSWKRTGHEVPGFLSDFLSIKSIATSIRGIELDLLLGGQYIKARSKELDHEVI